MTLTATFISFIYTFITCCQVSRRVVVAGPVIDISTQEIEIWV